MCGRYYYDDNSDNIDVNDILDKVKINYPETPIKTGDIFPTNIAPVLVGNRTELEPQPLIWGFPHFKGSGVIINARSETAEEKKMFRDSLFDRRCVIPTTGFFEWKQDGTKQKYFFQYTNDPLTYLAGFYNDFKGERRYVILTTDANDSMKEIHNRMPVVLPKEQLESWVFDLNSAMEMLHKTPPMLSRVEG
jgi:putative SOS response-associated peptidase YedK